MLQDHCHIIIPDTVTIKTDSSTFRFAGESCVTICSEELEACQLQHSVRYWLQSHVSMKHEREDWEKSLFSPQVAEFRPVILHNDWTLERNIPNTGVPKSSKHYTRKLNLQTKQDKTVSTNMQSWTMAMTIMMTILSVSTRLQDIPKSKLTLVS